MKFLALAVRLFAGEPVGTASCKFHPSCSRYAGDAVRKYGLARGALKAARRVVRCHPWSAGGVDYA